VQQPKVEPMPEGDEPKRRRGPYARSGRTSAAIVEAALEVFGQTGYRAGALKDVAMRAGVAEGSVFHHFASKELLLAAVLKRRDDLTDPVARMDDDEALHNLRGLVELADYNSRNVHLVRLHTQLAAEATAPEHPAYEYFVERYRRYVDRLTATYVRCEADGTLKGGMNPRSAARLTVSTLDGIQIQWLLDLDGVDMPAEVAAALGAWVAGPPLWTTEDAARSASLARSGSPEAVVAR
jgi:AcrR family transcriptional regulator